MLGDLLRAAIVCAAASACDPPAKAPSRAVFDLGENQARLSGVAVDRFEADALRTRTHLDTAVVDRETGALTGAGARIEVRSEEDPSHVRATITAPRARSELAARTFALEGGVHLVDDEGRTVDTDAADYDASKDDLSSRGPVRIAGENFVVRGSRLTGRPRAGALRIDGPVTATVTP